MTDSHTGVPGKAYPGPSLPTPDHIRLLFLRPGDDNADIECELVATELHSAPAYEALSYTWGDFSAHRVIHILTPGTEEPRDFPVTSNCFSALTRLRPKEKEKPRAIWIDALCIDQSNLSEKSHQVTLMSKIYSQAANVVVYLGEATEDSDEAIDFIMECDSPSSETSSLSHPKSGQLIQALNSFFHRPWFTRVWVIQEAVLSSSGIVYCGERTLDWSAIKNFNKWNTSTHWLRKLPFVVSISKQKFTTGNPGSVMLKALLKARHCGATNPRDKVYALLPLLQSFDKQFALTPRYEESLAKVYTNCALNLSPDCGFEILYAVQGGPRIDDLPSWVPDWSIPPRRSVLGTIGRIAQSPFWKIEKHVDVPLNPQVITSVSTDTDNAVSISLLRVSSFSVGKIAKIGPTFLAGQGPFPFNDWKALVTGNESVESVKSVDRTKETPESEQSNMVRYHFHEVIGAAGFTYPHAISQFIRNEVSQAGGADHLSSTGSPESRAFDHSWESTVRRMARERSSETEPEDSVLPYNEIPFHLAASYLVPSYTRYVQTVLRNCHSRRFFVTDTGYMGIAPEESQVDDQVYIFVDATMPFVLRQIQESPPKQGPKRFRLLGECHVEATAWGNLKARTDAPQYLDIV